MTIPSVLNFSSVFIFIINVSTVHTASYNKENTLDFNNESNQPSILPLQRRKSRGAITIQLNSIHNNVELDPSSKELKNDFCHSRQSVFIKDLHFVSLDCLCKRFPKSFLIFN